MAVRATATSNDVNSRVRRAWLLLGAFALFAILPAALLAWWLSRQLDAPLLRLVAAAHRVGDGDFTSRAPRSGVAEIDDVAEAAGISKGLLYHYFQGKREFYVETIRSASLKCEIERIAMRGLPLSV